MLILRGRYLVLRVPQGVKMRCQAMEELNMQGNNTVLVRKWSDSARSIELHCLSWCEIEHGVGLD